MYFKQNMIIDVLDYNNFGITLIQYLPMKLIVNGFQTFLYEKPGCGESPGPYGTLPPPTLVELPPPVDPLIEF